VADNIIPRILDIGIAPVAFLLLPVSLGILVRHRSLRMTARILPTISAATTVCILVLLALVLANPASRPRNIPETLAVSAAFIAISSALGGAFLPFLQRRPGERTALALCLPVRNVGIVALLAIHLLDESHIVNVAAVYFSVEVAVSLPAAVMLGRRARSAASS
jgi:predicted Na+-dependent transporter